MFWHTKFKPVLLASALVFAGLALSGCQRLDASRLPEITKEARANYVATTLSSVQRNQVVDFFSITAPNVKIVDMKAARNREDGTVLVCTNFVGKTPDGALAVNLIMVGRFVKKAEGGEADNYIPIVRSARDRTISKAFCEIHNIKIGLVRQDIRGLS